MVARASWAVETPPSTEFSIAIIAASDATLHDVGERFAHVADRAPLLPAGFGHLSEGGLGEGAGRPEEAVRPARRFPGSKVTDEA